MVCNLLTIYKAGQNNDGGLQVLLRFLHEKQEGCWAGGVWHPLDSEVLEFRTLQAARLGGTALSVCGVLRAWRKYVPGIPLMSPRSSPSPRVLPPSRKAPTCNRSSCVKQLTGAGLKTILLYGRYI